jgi:hypothetical protein
MVNNGIGIFYHGGKTKMHKYTCMICNRSTIHNDKVCLKCHGLKPKHIPREQYIKYFKQLAKKIHNDNIREE